MGSITVKQADILTFAINGIRRELDEAREEVIRLGLILEELLDLDKGAIPLEASRGFAQEPLIKNPGA